MQLALRDSSTALLLSHSGERTTLTGVLITSLLPFITHKGYFIQHSTHTSGLNWDLPDLKPAEYLLKDMSNVSHTASYVGRPDF